MTQEERQSLITHHIPQNPETELYIAPAQASSTLAQEERQSLVTHQIPRKPVGSVSSVAESSPESPVKNEVAAEATEASDDEYINSTPCGNWKPFPLRWPFLSFLILLHVAFIIVVQLLVSPRDKLAGPIARLSTQFDERDKTGYFMWQFFPTGCAVVAGGLWGMADTDLRGLAPYFAMARPEGATMDESLSVDYVSEYLFLVPFLAGKKKEWAVVCSSSVYILASIALPAVAGQMWLLDFTDSDLEPPVRVEFKLEWLHTFQALNGLIIIIGVLILFLLGTRRSGLHKDPSSLANIASVMSESTALLHVLQPLRSFDPRESLNRSLGMVRFYLRQPDKKQPVRIIPRLPAGFKIVPDDKEFKQSRSEAHSVWLWGRALLLLHVLMLAPFIVVTVALVQSYENSDITINPFFLRLSGTLIFLVLTTLYQTLQRELSIMQPFYDVAPRKYGWPGKGGPLPYSYTGQTSVQLIWYGLRTDASILSMVSIWSFFLQVITVFLPPMLASVFDILVNRDPYAQIPYVIEQAIGLVRWLEWVLAAPSILAFVGLILHKRKPIVPRQPNTLVSQMTYLCGSDKILQDMRGTSHMREKELKEYLEDLSKESKEPVFQWFQDQRGTWRVGIEYKPAGRKYTYGQSAPPPETV